MAKDMHKEEWDNTTLTKLDVFEQYTNDWLNVALNYQRNDEQYKTLEIYDLFCGSGYDGTKTIKGSPLRILDVVLRRNRNGKTIKIYFNDKNKNKVKHLKSIVMKKYPNLEDKNVQVEYISSDAKEFRLNSKNYYKLIFLDQYGVRHNDKVKEFLCPGTDILIFIASGHCRRFLKLESFRKYLDSEHISREDFKGKTSHETHRVMAGYFRKYLLNDCFVAPFTLIKDNSNVNGLIFISTHRKGQEQFLKTAWEIDKDFGEGNINIDKDISRIKGTLFYDESAPTQKEEEYEGLLLKFLREKRSNIDIKNFGLDNGFLIRHTKKILTKIKKDLEIYYCNGSKHGFHLDKNKKVLDIKLKDNQ